MKKPFYKKWWFIALIALFVIGAVIDDEEVANEPAEVAEVEAKVKETVAPEEPEKTEEEIRLEEEAVAKATAEQKAKEEAEQAKKEAERLARLEALKISGSGDVVTKAFQLEKGFVIIKSTHNGSRNFAKTLYDSNGQRVDLVTNTIGSYSGAQVLAVDAGEYKFEVSADGAWTIEMSQEVPEDVLPQGTASGKGDSVVFMNIEKGSYTVSATHKGKRNFAVRANDSALLFNEIGNYDGSIIQNVNDTSIYFFNISADGDWSFTFE